jgi:hypothetical protein
MEVSSTLGVDVLRMALAAISMSNDGTLTVAASVIRLGATVTMGAVTILSVASPLGLLLAQITMIAIPALTITTIGAVSGSASLTTSVTLGVLAVRYADIATTLTASSILVVASQRLAASEIAFTVMVTLGVTGDLLAVGSAGLTVLVTLTNVGGIVVSGGTLLLLSTSVFTAFVGFVDIERPIQVRFVFHHGMSAPLTWTRQNENAKWVNEGLKARIT